MDLLKIIQGQGVPCKNAIEWIREGAAHCRELEAPLDQIVQRICEIADCDIEDIPEMDLIHARYTYAYMCQAIVTEIDIKRSELISYGVKRTADFEKGHHWVFNEPQSLAAEIEEGMLHDELTHGIRNPTSTRKPAVVKKTKPATPPKEKKAKVDRAAQVCELWSRDTNIEKKDMVKALTGEPYCMTPAGANSFARFVFKLSEAFREIGGEPTEAQYLELSTAVFAPKKPSINQPKKYYDLMAAHL